MTSEPRAVRTEVSRVKPAVRWAATDCIACRSNAGAQTLTASPARMVATLSSTKTSSPRRAKAFSQTRSISASEARRGHHPQPIGTTSKGFSIPLAGRGRGGGIQGRGA